MQALVGGAIDAGAIGFSTSSNPTHRGAGGKPVPSRLADLDELLALVEPLRQRRRGVLSVLAGERIAHRDVFTVQRHAARPMTWMPMLVMPGFPHDELLAANTEARGAGHDIWAQTTCRPIVFQENLRAPFTLPRFAAFAELPADITARVALLRDPQWRRRAEDELAAGDRAMDWDAMSVAEHATEPELVGRRIVDIAAARAVTPLAAMVDVALADGLAARFDVAVANRDVDAVTALLQAPGVLIGLADSGAHVAQLCDACFSSELLGTWVRERGVLGLEAAVRRLTTEPATFLGLADRGVLAQGAFADICVFDPDTIAPGPLRRVHDFPANGERLTADRPGGIRHVLVNGTPIVRDGADAAPDQLPGRVLRSIPDPT